MNDEERRFWGIARAAEVAKGSIPRIPCGPGTRHRPDCPGCVRARFDAAMERLAHDTAPNMSTLALELDTPYVPPTASREDELPDYHRRVDGPRYPLMRIDRAHAGAWVLLLHLLALLWWRVRGGSTTSYDDGDAKRERP